MVNSQGSGKGSGAENNSVAKAESGSREPVQERKAPETKSLSDRDTSSAKGCGENSTPHFIRNRQDEFCRRPRPTDYSSQLLFRQKQTARVSFIGSLPAEWVPNSRSDGR